VAAYNGHLNVVELLFKHKIYFDYIEFAIKAAAINGHNNVVKSILQRGIYIYSKEENVKCFIKMLPKRILSQAVEIHVSKHLCIPFVNDMEKINQRIISFLLPLWTKNLSSDIVNNGIFQGMHKEPYVNRIKSQKNKLKI
jgi:hypothetical protein